MPNLNRVFLMGHITRDPALSYLPSQTAAVEFGLAINRKFKKQDGSQGEEICFVDLQMFGKRAETIQKYFKKGDPIFIEGRLKFESWEKDGKKHSKLRVMVENFEFIGGKKTENTEPYPKDNGLSNEPIPEDDIPF